MTTSANRRRWTDEEIDLEWRQEQLADHCRTSVASFRETQKQRDVKDDAEQQAEKARTRLLITCSDIVRQRLNRQARWDSFIDRVKANKGLFAAGVFAFCACLYTLWVIFRMVRN